MKSSAEIFEEHAELISATQTPEAQAAIRAAGLLGGKQLLLTALAAYLKRPEFLSPEEEEKFLKRGHAATPPQKKPRITDTEKRRPLYLTLQAGKLFRFVEGGIAVERADGTLHLFLDRMPVRGWNGHMLVRSDNAKPTARDIPTTTPFDEDAMFATEAGSVIAH
jgi:hypothetical protein